MTIYPPCKISSSVGSASNSTACWLPCSMAGIACPLMFDKSRPWISCSSGTVKPGPASGSASGSGLMPLQCEGTILAFYAFLGHVTNLGMRQEESETLHDNIFLRFVWLMEEKCCRTTQLKVKMNSAQSFHTKNALKAAASSSGQRNLDTREWLLSASWNILWITLQAINTSICWTIVKNC